MRQEDQLAGPLHARSLFVHLHDVGLDATKAFYHDWKTDKDLLRYKNDFLEKPAGQREEYLQFWANHHKDQRRTRASRDHAAYVESLLRKLHDKKLEQEQRR